MREIAEEVEGLRAEGGSQAFEESRRRNRRESGLTARKKFGRPATVGARRIERDPCRLARHNARVWMMRQRLPRLCRTATTPI